MKTHPVRVMNIIGSMLSLLAAIDGSESKASLLTGGTEVFRIIKNKNIPSGESNLAGPTTTREDVTTSIREDTYERSTEWRRVDDVADRRHAVHQRSLQDRNSGELHPTWSLC
ncbi:hypothetical protein PanWU01x14_242470 [Parasponia andersonii]|uniref:Uncharacterized protein n=1 Tax=Parasponia andersonii TaxID=3476 RepID=A0A2P5BFZ5_PARAD|nr:hypothetical protein PanWU01x14_242470 [Parasponia andersonii]